MMDLVFYLGPQANSNMGAIEAFIKTEARKCFRKLEIVRAVPMPPGVHEAEVENETKNCCFRFV